MKPSLSLLIILLLTACVVIQSRSLSEWIGHHVDEMVNQWGPPNGVYPFQNGDKLFQYSSGGINQYSTYTPGSEYCHHKRCFYNNGYEQSYIQQTQCNTRFTISPTHVIKSVIQEGECSNSPSKYPVVPLVVQSTDRQIKKPYCREVSSAVKIDGKPQQVYTTNCLQSDGSWAPAK